MKIILLILAMGMMVACESIEKENREIGLEKSKKSQSYFKDVYGICYSTIISRTYGGYFVTSLTTVPCEKVGL